MANNLVIKNNPPANSYPDCVRMKLELKNSNSNKKPLRANLNFSTEWKEITTALINCKVEFALIEGEMSLKLNGCKSTDNRFKLAQNFGCMNSSVTTIHKWKENKKSSKGTSTTFSLNKSVDAGIKGQSTQEIGKERENTVQDYIEEKRCFVVAKGEDTSPSWKFTRKWWKNENYIENHFNELFTHIVLDENTEKGEVRAEFSIPRKEYMYVKNASLKKSNLILDSILKQAIIAALARKYLYLERQGNLCTQKILVEKELKATHAIEEK